MTLTWEQFTAYADRMGKINRAAAKKIRDYVVKYGLTDTESLIDYCYAIATQYGEASAAMAAQMYDAIAEMSGVSLSAAEVAATAKYGEVAEVVNGILQTSQNTDMIAGGVERLVKKAGETTTIRNAYRDGAQIAWVPNGDTCPYCIMQASHGWRNARQSTYANHFHANCDCSFMVRHKSAPYEIKGYDPKKYADMWDDADGTTRDEKLNAMRRDAYAKNKDEINAQKRSAYAKRMALNAPDAEEIEI